MIEKGTRNRSLAFLYICLSLLPVSLELGGSGDKPLQFVCSDLLILALLPMVVIRPFRVRAIGWQKILYAGVMAAAYLTVLGAIGTLQASGSLTPFLSALRLSKPFLLMFSGVYLFSGLPLSWVANSYRYAATLTLGIIFLSDLLLNASFPICRWGGNFLGLEVFGFPNSSTFFTVCLIILAFPTEKRWSSIKLTESLVCFLGAFWVVMSLSRNGVLSLALTLLYVLAGYMHNATSKFLGTIIIGSLLIGTVGFFTYYIETVPFVPTEGIALRIDRTIEYEDPSSGRFSIWQYALQLILERPVFGYCFEPFSNHSVDFDTPHSQYLEVMYKAGAIGLLLFAAPFVLMFRMLKKTKCALQQDQQFVDKIVLILLVASVSSFFQPNFSYSVFANFVCVLAGTLAVAKHALAPKNVAASKTALVRNRTRASTYVSR